MVVVLNSADLPFLRSVNDPRLTPASLHILVMFMLLASHKFSIVSYKLDIIMHPLLLTLTNLCRIVNLLLTFTPWRNIIKIQFTAERKNIILQIYYITFSRNCQS